MAWSAFDQDADRQAYIDLVERNRRDKLNNKAAIKGGVGGGIVESPMDIVAVRDWVKQTLMQELAPYTDSQGNIAVEL